MFLLSSLNSTKKLLILAVSKVRIILYKLLLVVYRQHGIKFKFLYIKTLNLNLRKNIVIRTHIVRERPITNYCGRGIIRNTNYLNIGYRHRTSRFRFAIPGSAEPKIDIHANFPLAVKQIISDSNNVSKCKNLLQAVLLQYAEIYIQSFVNKCIAQVFLIIRGLNSISYCV